MNPLTTEQLAAIMPKCPGDKLLEYTAAMNVAMVEATISTVLRASAWLANIAHESNQCREFEEDLNYSAQAIWDLWPRRFSTLADAIPYAHAPALLANKVYCDRMGNGSQASGDGWRYRGRGPSMLTGAEAYQKFGDLLGIDLPTHPELAASPEYGFHIAGLFWLAKGMSVPADVGDFPAIVKLWNGGFNGLAQRQAYYERSKNVLG